MAFATIIEDTTKTAPVAAMSNGELDRYILEQIRTSGFAPGHRLRNAQALAREWGLRPGAVRYALQRLTDRGILVRKPGSGTYLREDVTIRGDLSISAGTQLSNVFAMLVPDISKPEYSYLAREIQDVSHEKGLDVIVNSTDDDPHRYDEIIRRHIKANVLGLIMVPPLRASLPIDVIAEIHRACIPVVTCYRRVSYNNWWPVVCNNHEKGFYVAAKHLCETGCRDVALFVSGAQESKTFREAHYMFLKALFEMSAKVDMNNVFTNENIYDDGAGSQNADTLLASRVEDWLLEHPGVDGICCSDDRLAAIVLRTLRGMGKQVPQDVAVVGNGNLLESYGLFPGELTTLDSCFHEMANNACDLILKMRDAGQCYLDEVFMPEMKLIKGESTASRLESEHGLLRHTRGAAGINHN